MGKRQRHTEFIGRTDDYVTAIASDPKTPADLRRKAVTEQKYRGLRDKKKRKR